MDYILINKNPYIAGNCLTDDSVFFGREDVFQDIRKLFSRAPKGEGVIITLAGEQRSGKTSLLNQINEYHDRIGGEYLPVYIDIQSIINREDIEKGFFLSIDNIIRAKLNMPLNIHRELNSDVLIIEKTLVDIQNDEKYPGKKLVLMFDEYEEVGEQIENNVLNRRVIDNLISLLDKNVFFIFAGSKGIKNKHFNYWKQLINKSQSVPISLLKKDDFIDLITNPCEGKVRYSEEMIEKIYRLTAGQPLYTQSFCYNMVDHLKYTRKNEVGPADFEFAAKEAITGLNNPLQTFWKYLTPNEKLVLSLSAELIRSDEDWIDSNSVNDCLKKKQLEEGKNEKEAADILSLKDIKATINHLIQREIFEKSSQHNYRFRYHIDFIRLWILETNQDYSIIADEVGIRMMKFWKMCSAEQRTILSILAEKKDPFTVKSFQISLLQKDLKQKISEESINNNFVRFKQQNIFSQVAEDEFRFAKDKDRDWVNENYTIYQVLDDYIQPRPNKGLNLRMTLTISVSLLIIIGILMYTKTIYDLASQTRARFEYVSKLLHLKNETKPPTSSQVTMPRIKQSMAVKETPIPGVVKKLLYETIQSIDNENIRDTLSNFKLLKGIAHPTLDKRPADFFIYLISELYNFSNKVFIPRDVNNWSNEQLLNWLKANFKTETIDLKQDNWNESTSQFEFNLNTGDILAYEVDKVEYLMIFTKYNNTNNVWGMTNKGLMVIELIPADCNKGIIRIKDERMVNSKCVNPVE